MSGVPGRIQYNAIRDISLDRNLSLDELEDLVYIVREADNEFRGYYSKKASQGRKKPPKPTIGKR
jgi:hypothetical protein